MSRVFAGAARVAMVLTLSGATVLTLPAGSAQAADACLDPVVREVNVSQGLPSYTNLVRGKTTLFKTFLSEKSTSGCTVLNSSSLFITGGSVTVTGSAATPLVVPGGVSLPSLPTYSTAPVANIPGDPVFAISGSKITSALTTATSLSFTATLSYVAKDDKRGTTLQTGSIAVSTTPITRQLNAVTRPLRELVVPLGDENSTVAQFPPAAQTTLQNAMLAASRIQPVADGVGDLTGTTGGLRYTVAAGLINLGTHDELQPDGSLRSFNYMPNGLFCGGSASFTYLRQKLGDFRLAWNAAHPSTPADRVLGVVWQGVSDGPTTNSSSTCAEGYAAVNGPEAWVRLAEPATGSPSGGVAALELQHTYGGVVGAIGYHSTATAADGTAPGRAFNTTTLTQIAAPKSALRFDVTGWNNYTTLFEKRDWDFTLCMLASTASPATECGSATSGGTTAPAGGGFHINGSIDFALGDIDVHTRFAPSVSADGFDSGARLRLALINGSNEVVSDLGLRNTNQDSRHTEPGGSAGTDDRYGFDVAIQGDKTAAFELWDGTPRAAAATLHYRRVLNNAPSSAVTARLGASVASPFSNDGASSAASAGGSLLARSRSGQVVLTSLTSPAALASVPGQSGTLTDTGTTLSVTSAGDVFTYPITSGTPGARRTIYTGGGLLAPGAASSPVLVGTSLVFTAAGDLYAVDTTSPLLPATATMCGIGQAQPAMIPGNPCSRWTSTPGAVERPGSWSSSRGLLAYTSTTTAGAASVWTLSPTNPTGSALSRIAGVSNPAWLGELLVVTGSNGLRAYNATTYDTPSSLTGAPGDTQPTVAGTSVFFTRPAGSATDLWRLAMDRQTFVITSADENPQDIRHDIYADCGDGPNPKVTATRPTAVNGSTSVTEVTLSPDRTCPNPDWQIDTTDGYSVTTTRIAGTGSPQSSAAVYSPQAGSTQPAFQPIVISGEATGDFTYLLTGPAGSGYEGGVVVSQGSDPDVVVQPGPAGFTPGLWCVRLTTTGADGPYTVTVCFTVAADADGDGIVDADDSQAVHSCYPVDAVTNTQNAVTDYDNDLLISLVDPDPCTTALNATVNFDANSINLASKGNYVTVYISTQAFDLRTLVPSQVRVTQLGGFHADIPAISLAATASQLTAKFSRPAFQNAYQQLGLRGYVPVLITGSNGTATFSGYDPTNPTYNP